MNLGRRVPTDWRHYELHPLTLGTTPEKATPVVLGINWYSAFDSPWRDSATGRYWIGRGASWGSIRGGHAICARPERIADLDGWWDFYNQKSTSGCVGFSESRCMSLLNRERYDAPWLYLKARQNDEWPGEEDSGTSLRAGFGILLNRGHRRVYNGVSQPVALSKGISAYRWGDVEDALRTLYNPLATRHYEDIGGFPLVNSWGRGYPHYVWMTLEGMDRLLDEDGEIGVPTDR